MPRGRPKKSDPFAWMNDPPPYLDEAFPEGNLAGIREFNRQETERLRRETVSESIVAAYSEGRNTANANRNREREERRLALSVKSEVQIASNMPASSVATYISRIDPGIDLTTRTLREYVVQIRKLAGPYRVKK